jgi:hypothetical protein
MKLGGHIDLENLFRGLNLKFIQYITLIRDEFGVL